MNKLIRVTAAILERDGKILLAKRKKDDPLKGKWEFPGGKIERNESPEDCLRRELHEELGIDVKVGAFFCSSTFAYEHIAVDLLVYRIASFTGVAKAYDHAELAWVTPADLMNYDLPEADKPIIHEILKYSRVKR
jgi:8-oxo-dGTP diphosphatase